MGLKRLVHRDDPAVVVRFRRTLVGLKHRNPPFCQSVGEVFQKNPCGIEAFTTDILDDMIRVFQKNPCGIEARSGSAKPESKSPFQKNPCGIEATRYRNRPSLRGSFRRTLVGLKHHIQGYTEM